MNNKPFSIRVINKKTGRGIPLVELRTTNCVSYYTDSAGYIAFNEPGLMDQSVFFYIESDGYKYHSPSVVIDITPSGSITLEMEQVNIAERLYRITGQGIYRDSTELGIDVPIKHPNLNGRVAGSDSTQTAVYNNKIYWIWGDTIGPFHELGNFRVTAAVSELPENGGLDPSVGVDLKYFTREDGFVREMVPPLPDKATLVWIFPVFTVKDSTGKERLLAGYGSLNSLTEPVGRGILMFNDELERWEQIAEFHMEIESGCGHHATGGGTLYKDNGKDYWLFTQPLPVTRVLSDIDAVKDQSRYEMFTPLKPGTSFKGADTEIDRDEEGNIIWGWKLNSYAISQQEEDELIRLGLIDPVKDVPHFQYRDVDTGKRVYIHANTIRWNPYRNKWVLITSEKDGTSTLGEIWYGESDSITGPWGPLKKIVSHKVMSFYNPLQHEYFQEDNGRVIYFEGTYTDFLTGAKPTPFYNYNQIMYRLELDDPRLGLPLELPKTT